MKKKMTKEKVSEWANVMILSKINYLLKRIFLQAVSNSFLRHQDMHHHAGGRVGSR